MTVIDEIAAERKRQIEAEGWTPGHDDQHIDGSLALAAAAYCAHSSIWSKYVSMIFKTPKADDYRSGPAPSYWPFHKSFWKPKDPRRDLIRASALIVAEIERLDRLDERNRLDREG